MLIKFARSVPDVASSLLALTKFAATHILDAATHAAVHDPPAAPRCHEPPEDAACDGVQKSRMINSGMPGVKVLEQAGIIEEDAFDFCELHRNFGK